MAQNITLMGASYSAVPAVDLPKTGGGTARFTDVSPTTAGDSDVASGKIYFKSDGSQSTGTGSSGGGGNEFAVVVSWDTSASKWTPNKTYAEIIAANGAGKVIAVTTDKYALLASADGAVSGSVFEYTVWETTEISERAAVHSRTYQMTSSAISLQYEDFFLIPEGTLAITGSGNTGVGLYDYVSVQAGTAGTPSATKGTVSNHSVSVTPSVTNATGWITGGTKTGTPVTVSASELVSGSETKTANGTYDVTTLQTLVVNVSGGSVSTDTKTTTASNYPTSLSFTSMKGQPKMFTLKLNAQVSSSGNTTYYYIVDITSHGTTTHGNCFRIGSTRRIDNITSGYSWSYSGTTLTISSSAASRSASPGAFYNGSYELMYVY